MYCYKDTTYCASPNCKNECGRKLTPEIWESAKKAEMMIAQSYFCGSPEIETQGFAVTPDNLKSLLREES